MTQEEKAKRYDEAIKRAKELLEIGVKDTRDKRVVLSFFPELKESEDERIRKEIIQFFKEKDEEDFEEWVPKVEVLTWLEKQGHDGKKWIYEDVYIKEKEQLIQDGIDEVLENPQKYGLEKQGEQKPVIEMKTPEESLGVNSDTYNKIVDECVYGEQKSAWSEEDEEEFQIAIDTLVEAGQHDSANWLKSLKERYT